MAHNVYMCVALWLTVIIGCVPIEIIAEAVYWRCTFWNTFYCLQCDCWMMISVLCSLATSKYNLPKW